MSKDITALEIHGKDLEERALLVLEIYRKLCAEIGQEKAVSLLSTANHKVGCWKGQWMAADWPQDITELPAHLAALDIAHWSRELTADGNDSLHVQYTECPYKRAWRNARVEDDELSILCKISGNLGKGLFEAAGYAVSHRTWQAGEQGCCAFELYPN